MENVTVAIKLKKDLKDRLDELSRARKESQASLLNRAIAEFITSEGMEEGPSKDKAKAARKNVFSFFSGKKPLSHAAPWQVVHDERSRADADRY